MASNDRDTFCKKMRKATKQVHTISDSLVNTKLAFGFLDNAIWADGLLVFYEVFRHLEWCATRWKHTEIGLFPLDELRRTEAFERDLEHYLGKEWRAKCTTRDAVAKYLKHLTEIENTNPILLIAYIYHLYMGLLSGGIILRKKRQFVQKFCPFKELRESGDNVTNFGNINIFELKRRMRDTMNEIAEGLDQDVRNKLIEESKMVFALNNELIKSVRGAGFNIIRKIFFLSVPFLLILFAFLLTFQ